MVVTLGAPYYDENGDKSNYSFKDHIALYDWAFSEFVYTNIVKMNEQVTQVDESMARTLTRWESAPPRIITPCSKRA